MEQKSNRAPLVPLDADQPIAQARQPYQPQPPQVNTDWPGIASIILFFIGLIPVGLIVV